MSTRFFSGQLYIAIAHVSVLIVIISDKMLLTLSIISELGISFLSKSYFNA